MGWNKRWTNNMGRDNKRRINRWLANRGDMRGGSDSIERD
jgi:hypothetical protein